MSSTRLNTNLKCLPVYCLVVFLVVLCLRCLLRFFSVLPTKVAEAGMKGDMSYLNAPDA